MGLKHEAKKGTTITANGVTVTVLRGSPLLEITAAPEVVIRAHQVEDQHFKFQRHRPKRSRLPRSAEIGTKPSQDKLPTMPRMQLWTYHPSTFYLLTAPRVQWEKGHGHVPEHEREGYLAAREELSRRVGTDQFLFCCVTDDPFVRRDENEDLLEWRIEIPDVEVLKFIRSEVWNRIRVGKSLAGDWDRLFIDHAQAEYGATGEDLQAIVPFPTNPQYLSCVGKAPMIDSKEASDRKRRARLAELSNSSCHEIME